MKEQNAYILGTDQQELHRLGLQHQVWASEAQQGWHNAGFKEGDHLIDLGAGPGFCSKEMAFMVGDSGSVTGVDRSANYIEFLNAVADQYQLPLKGICADFNDMELPANYFDGMYCRWAMAWVPNPKEILGNVAASLKKGAKVVLHEYFDWTTHQIEPNIPELTVGIHACIKSFREQDGDIDVGRFLPQILTDLGFKVTSKRLMHKLAQPHQFDWQWPKSFYYSYFPRLVDSGYLTQEECDKALAAHSIFEKNPNAMLFTPIMIEVVAEKL
ncbi:MAG: class I SAM-dependent methyltransferase [bacterium]